MHVVSILFVWFLIISPAFSADTEEVSDGLRQILNRSASAAVDKLGVENGFLDNPKVRIPLPKALQKAEGLMRTLGGSKYADSVIIAMNHAAETAAAEAEPLVLDAIKSLPLQDAKQVMSGDDDSVTQYFRETTSEALAQQFLPVVKEATDQVGLLKKYNEFASKGVKFGLIPEKDAAIENYVTRKTLDGLYLMMAEEERSMRINPMGQTKEVQGVLGALKQSR